MTITLFFKETDYSLRKNSSRGKIKFSEDQNRPQERFCKTLHVVHKPDFQTEIWRVFNCIHLWFNQYCKLIKFRKVYNSRKLCIRQQFSMQKNIFYIFMCMIKNNGDVFPFVQFMCLPVDGGTMSSAVSFFFFSFFFPPQSCFLIYVGYHRVNLRTGSGGISREDSGKVSLFSCSERKQRGKEKRNCS